MNDLLNKSKINRFGLSIYEIKHIKQDEAVSILQVPGNIFNQDVIKSDKLKIFTENGGKVQIRSIFIQGLLLMDPSIIPKKFDELKKGIIHFNNISNDLKVDKKQLAIKCIEALVPGAKIIIGLDNIAQLKDLIELNNSNIKKSDIKEVLKICNNYDNKLWDPRIW